MPDYSQDQIEKMQAAVLGSFVTCGVIGIALDTVGVSHKVHRHWLEDYPEYKERLEEIKERFVDGLESVAIERAKSKSDALLILMLKAHRGKVYNVGENLNLTSDKPVNVIFSDSMLNEDEKKLLTGKGEEDGE